ncbi:MAG: Sirohydrochlorin ferrochelatase CfbA [Candidatus Methanohalarchaeum thermophilum]|uniref:Sirohydrochlorin ferrochelatase CfbA n=1 Tax=Methanohalarchaeum thermophilum TaxID=1903181 RepID=A0A1Q6DVR2_METT1|nr:MAG: Sirohydrochlorin ferrochelatase CfbA [Candidatus Methanohalarchaeum thermophilum]
MDEDIGVLVVGHGSKKDYNKELIMGFASELESDFEEVEYSFLSMNEPSIPESLGKLKEKDLEKIVIFPLFLANGVHTLVDIPGVLGFEEGQRTKKVEENGKEIDLIYSNPIGLHEKLVDIGEKRIEESLENHD